MEILQKLESYLSGKETYKFGTELYQLLGSNNSLKELFAEPEDDYSIEKLHSELKKIYDRLNIPKSENKFKSFSVSKKMQRVDLENLPDYLRKEHARLSPILNERGSLHATLDLLSSDRLRFESAKRIIELNNMRREIWARIDHYSATGNDHPMFAKPIESEHEKITLAEAQKSIKLLRSQRSKLKNNIHRYIDYQRICAEIKLLEKIIKDEQSAI